MSELHAWVWQGYIRMILRKKNVSNSVTKTLICCWHVDTYRQTTLRVYFELNPPPYLGATFTDRLSSLLLKPDSGLSIESPLYISKHSNHTHHKVRERVISITYWTAHLIISVKEKLGKIVVWIDVYISMWTGVVRINPVFCKLILQTKCDTTHIKRLLFLSY